MIGQVIYGKSNRPSVVGLLSQILTEEMRGKKFVIIVLVMTWDIFGKYDERN